SFPYRAEGPLLSRTAGKAASDGVAAVVAVALRRAVALLRPPGFLARRDVPDAVVPVPFPVHDELPAGAIEVDGVLRPVFRRPVADDPDDVVRHWRAPGRRLESD